MNSYCSECDSDHDPCHEHPAARRYLAPIVYERTASGGYRVPDDERERWDNPTKTDQPVRRSGAARTIDELLADLDDWVFVSPTMRTALHSAYDRSPQRLTRLVDKTIAGTSDGTLTNPDGYLAKYVSELAKTP